MFTDLAGNPIQLDYPNIHHRNEVLVDVGDLQFYAHLAGKFLGLQASVRFGLSLPFGKVHENPYLLGALGLPHEHIQFGTGTFDPLFGLDVQKDFGSWSLAGFAQTQVPLYEGPRGYQAGARATEGTIPFAGDYSVSFDVQARVYGYTFNAQLSLPVVVEVSIGRLFHLESNRTDFAPVPESIPSGAADTVDVVQSGELKPLAAVSGKWTIFDFWAPWCEACKAVDDGLQRLANSRTDVAVRRINIVDFDSPISRQELAGVFELPHVRLTDPNGKLVWEFSGTPEEIMRRIDDSIR